MTWHRPDEGCNVTVRGDADEVITITCVNTEGVMSPKPHRYHVALSANANALMVMEADGYGGIHYFSDAEAKRVLVEDEVWYELPAFFRNRIVWQ